MDWYLSLAKDTDANDTSKDFVAQGDWQLLAVRVRLVTTATAGNRLVTMQIYDDSDATNVLLEMRSGVAQVASKDYSYYFAPGLSRLTSVYDSDYVSCPIPNIMLHNHQMLRICDLAAVAADSDDMEVFISGVQKQSLWQGNK